MSGGRKRKAPDNPLDISFSSTEDGYDDDSDEPISIDEPQQNEEQANYVKESPVVLGKIASGALAPISNALFERFVAKTQKRQKAASAIEENTWFLEFEKLQKAPEGLRFSMAQPLTVHFCNQILFMKQCGNEDCGFKIVHQPNDAASVIGRCPNCCGWTPQENDEESTSLIPQYKLVCCKPVEIEGSMQLVYFILPQDVANACVPEVRRIPYAEMVQHLAQGDACQEFCEDVAKSLDISRIQMSDSTVAYNRAGDSLVVDVRSAEMFI